MNYVMKFIYEWYTTNINCFEFVWRLKWYPHSKRLILSISLGYRLVKWDNTIFNLVDIFQLLHLYTVKICILFHVFILVKSNNSYWITVWKTKQNKTKTKTKTKNVNFLFIQELLAWCFIFLSAYYLIVSFDKW